MTAAANAHGAAIYNFTPRMRFLVGSDRHWLLMWWAAKRNGLRIPEKQFAADVGPGMPFAKCSVRLLSQKCPCPVW